MNRDELLKSHLEALRHADDQEGAGPEVEKLLREAVQRRRRVAWIRRAGVGAIAATIALVWMMVRRPAEPVRNTTVTLSPPVIVQPAPREVPVQTATVRVVRKRPRPRLVPPPPKSEIATGFMTVMLDPDPFERGRMVRVKLPRSALASFGLPVNEERSAERIQADVLIGEDGLARAIRFVK